MLVRSGSKGSSVISVQKELKAAGISPGAVDGEFGPKTRAAVMRYQRKHRLEVDGVVGAKTWSALTNDGFKLGAARTTKPARPSVSGGRPSTKVQKLLAEARKHLGFHEGTGNRNPFSKALKDKGFKARNGAGREDLVVKSGACSAGSWARFSPLERKVEP